MCVWEKEDVYSDVQFGAFFQKDNLLPEWFQYDSVILLWQLNVPVKLGMYKRVKAQPISLHLVAGGHIFSFTRRGNIVVAWNPVKIVQALIIFIVVKRFKLIGQLELVLSPQPTDKGRKQERKSESWWCYLEINEVTVCWDFKKPDIWT